MNSDRRSQLLKFLKGEKSPEGERYFEVWTSQLMDDQEKISVNKEIGEGIKAGIDAKLNKRIQSKPSKKIILSRVALKIAASVAIFIVAGSASFYFLHKNPVRTYYAKNQVIKTIHVPYGEKDTVYLADGSTVYLNSGSEFSYPETFLEDTRDVTLKGEGFFEVAKNPQKPFIIHSCKIATKVLGTSFNIQDYPGENTRVTVRTGRVSVTAQNKSSLVLTPGEQACLMVNSLNLIKKQIFIKDFTGWQNNYLVFDNEPLRNVFRHIERTYNVKIQCTKAALFGKNIKSTFDNENIIGIMEDLKFIVGLEYTYNEKNKTIVITH